RPASALDDLEVGGLEGRGRPLGRAAGHVEDAVGADVLGEGADGPSEAVRQGGEPDPGEGPVEVVAPGIEPRVDAPGRLLPFRRGGKTVNDPLPPVASASGF